MALLFALCDFLSFFFCLMLLQALYSPRINGVYRKKQANVRRKKNKICVNRNITNVMQSEIRVKILLRHTGAKKEKSRKEIKIIICFKYTVETGLGVLYNSFGSISTTSQCCRMTTPYVAR
jgi:hypothetical protein